MLPLYPARELLLSVLRYFDNHSLGVSAGTENQNDNSEIFDNRETGQLGQSQHEGFDDRDTQHTFRTSIASHTRNQTPNVEAGLDESSLIVARGSVHQLCKYINDVSLLHIRSCCFLSTDFTRRMTIGTTKFHSFSVIGKSRRSMKSKTSPA